MSDSPELLKPDTEVTYTELQIEIGNLKAENQELKLQLHGSKDSEITLRENWQEANKNAQAWGKSLTKVQEALEKSKKEVEKSRSYFIEEQAENQKLKADYAALLKSSTDVTNKLREEVREVRSQLETERADREEVEAELSELKQKTATAGKGLPDAVDLTEKAGELLNLFKSLLPPKAKLPSGTISKIEKILEDGDDAD